MKGKVLNLESKRQSLTCICQANSEMSTGIDWAGTP